MGGLGAEGRGGGGGGRPMARGGGDNAHGAWLCWARRAADYSAVP